MAGLFKTFLKEGILHGKKLLCNPAYRNYFWAMTCYEHFPRYKEKTIKIGSYKLKIVDMPSFFSSYREIFIEEIYRFSSDKSSPIIVDIGSNIGLSILYIKKNFPEAQVIGYEADPYIYDVLKTNIDANNIKNVELKNQAVWIEKTTLNFCSDNADGGKLLSNNFSNSSEIIVQTVDIKDILKQHKSIDLLKIDIEGAEANVIPECKGMLGHVKNIFLEYHSNIDQKQNLDTIFNVLIESGFYLYTKCADAPVFPFINEKKSNHYDFQLNIWGKKHDR